jgi:hypothetical protein
MLVSRDQAGDHERAHNLLLQTIDGGREMGMSVLATKAQELIDRAGLNASLTQPASHPGLETDSIALPGAIEEKNIFRKEGHTWTVVYKGRVLRLIDAKGFSYLSLLLRHPHIEFHAHDLVFSTSTEEGLHSSSADSQTGGNAMNPPSLPRSSDAGEMLDERAKAEYKHRLLDLREELESAKARDQPERAERIEQEIEALVQELTRGVGLGGRDRRAASDSERARLNVTRAIKSAVRRISEENRDLATFLTRSIKTGTFCVYQPDPRETQFWDL